MADPKAHIGGPVVSTQQSFVAVEGVPIATVGDTCICIGIPTDDRIAGGSSVAAINGRKIARVGDRCNHGGTLVQGVSWITFE
ncbi:PAAR domain-containing protein [Rhizobium paknamense]|nr:PAAR domain-containing protein [Rhizobium paknamense]